MFVKTPNGAHALALHTLNADDRERVILKVIGEEGLTELWAHDLKEITPSERERQAMITCLELANAYAKYFKVGNKVKHILNEDHGQLTWINRQLGLCAVVWESGYFSYCLTSDLRP